MANKKLKGITIEIGGDTTKLGKALEDSEKKSRSLQTELRAIQQSLKFNPDNVELLAQKQTVLTQNIEETSKKLDTLKEAEKQVIAQFERGEIAEDQVRALQREIIKTENQLESMSSELKDTSKKLTDFSEGAKKAKKELSPDEIKEATDAYEELGDKASEAFDKVKTGIAVLGGATVAGAGYALNLSTEFDKAFNTLQTQTGASVEEMESLNESMENIYKGNFGESIEDVAQSMAIVKNQTKLTGNELETTTQNALLMRDVFGFEVNESVRTAKMLMEQYGISADEAFNLIAQGAQNGLDKNGDLLDTINEYAVHFKGLGIDSEEMFETLIAGAESGTFSVDKLGDAVKEFGIRAKDGSDASAEAFELLGYDAEYVTQKFNEGGESARELFFEVVSQLTAMDDSVEKTTAGVGLFGTMWEDLGSQGIESLLNEIGVNVDKTGDALNKINETKYDDIGSALQGLGRTLQTDLVDPIGDELKPVVEDAIEYVQENGPAIKDVISSIVETVGKIVSMIVDNGPLILGIISSIGAGFLAWKAVTIIGAIIPIFTSLITVIKGGTVAFQALNLAMKANIIGLIIGAITALVGAFIYLWNNCEGFRNFWLGLWENIKIAFSAFVEWISSALSSVGGFFSMLGEKISGIWAVILESLQPLIDSIVGAFREGWELIKIIWDFVSPFFLGIWESIQEIFSAVKTILSAYFLNAWELIKLGWSVAVSYFQTIWNNIKLVFSVVKTFFSGMFSSAWTAIKEVWKNAISFFSSIWNTIRDIFSVVKNVLTGNWRDAWNSIKGIVSTWASYFSGVWSSIKKIFGSVKSWFFSTFSSAWTAIKGVFSNWGSFFSGLWTKIKNTFSNIGTNIANAIGSSVKSALNGIISSIEGTINTGINLINGAIGIINQIPGVDIGTIGKLSLPRLYRGGVLKKGQVGLLEGDGAEAVVPLEQETGWINRIAQKMNELQDVNPNTGNVALMSKMDEMIQTMKNLNPAIVLDTGVLVGETINQIDTQLGHNYILKERRI